MITLIVRNILNIKYGLNVAIKCHSNKYFHLSNNMITRDAKLTETLYYDVMQQQQSGPLIRTQDLPNPFDTSLQENPSYLSPGGF